MKHDALLIWAAERGIRYRDSVGTARVTPTAAGHTLRNALGGWLHVDGAVGLRLAAAGRDRIPGLDRAGSWSTHAHKWLNVPHDWGITVCRHAAAHRASMTVSASYLVQAEPGTDRNPVDWNPEFSRRARGVPAYAALASLGRSGVVAIIERCCTHARHFAALLSREPGVATLNDVVLNRCSSDSSPRAGLARPDGDADFRAQPRHDHGRCGGVGGGHPAGRESLGGSASGTALAPLQSRS